MSDFTIQTHIAEALSTIENLIKCLDEEDGQSPRNLLLSGVIEFYKDGDIENFGIVMIEIFNKTAIDAMNRLKDEITEK